MIIRTYHFTRLDFFVIPLLVLVLDPKVVVCNCSSPHCLITSETRDRPTFVQSNEASRRPSVFVREVNLDDNDPGQIGLGIGIPNHRGLSAINASLKYAEGKRNDNQKVVIQVETKARPSVTPSTSLSPGADTKTGLQVNSSTVNASLDQIKDQDYTKSLAYKLNTAALLRGFYVFGGLGAMVVMYILVRTIRLRRKKSTVRKYGILTNREDVEMTPLGADDDEDMTIFEMNTHTRT